MKRVDVLDVDSSPAARLLPRLLHLLAGTDAELEVLRMDTADADRSRR